MSNFDDIDAQLAELQVQLKNDMKKTKINADSLEWPKPPMEFGVNKTPPLKDTAIKPKFNAKSNLPANKSYDFQNDNKETHKKPFEQPKRKSLSLKEKMELSESKLPSMGICHKCKTNIDGYGSGLMAMENQYHIECLVCLTCKKSLNGKEFIVKGKDDPYCQSCHEKSLKKCYECNHTIKNRLLRADDKTYHPECFKCTDCKGSLDGVPFTQNTENQPYCIECYHRLYSPKCDKCSKPIGPTNGETEGLRIIAMEKSYHKECFTCEECLESLANGGCYPVDGKFYCKTCSIKVTNK